MASGKVSLIRDLNKVREQAFRRSGKECFPSRGSNRHRKIEVGVGLAPGRNRRKSSVPGAER